jgi:hypothetical protein
MLFRSVLVFVLLAMLTPSPTSTPQRFLGLTRSAGQIPYDGRFILARLYYPFYPGWSYDYPEMEDNFGKILRSLTLIRPHPDGGNIFKMDDPELLKFPIAYLSEPGYWYPSESEVVGLRNFILKGGFLWVDDFHFPNEWQVFEDAMMRVLPHAKIERLKLSHPIFHSFFDIKSLELKYPGQLGEQGLIGEFYGIHEENDRTRRLTVIIDYNMDIGDYMEWSATGFYPVDPTNEAFKYAVNYIIYGLSH